jgi:hypothetical protein
MTTNNLEISIVGRNVKNKSKNVMNFILIFSITCYQLLNYITIISDSRISPKNIFITNFPMNISTINPKLTRRLK